MARATSSVTVSASSSSSVKLLKAVLPALLAAADAEIDCLYQQFILQVIPGGTHITRLIEVFQIHPKMAINSVTLDIVFESFV
jgi:hypothetical protein